MTTKIDPLADLAGLPALQAHESLADRVYYTVRDAIAHGTLPAGFRLREAALSKRLGVSTTPVREALRRLEREGLVELSPNRGATVAQFRPERWANLWEVRVLLSVHGVRRAALAEERDFTRIDRQLALESEAVSGMDIIQFGPLDIAFHRALNELSGNADLAELAEILQWRTQSMRILYAEQIRRTPAVSHAQHVAIVEAVRERDADRAEALILEHIASEHDSILRMLESSPPAP